jgi:hypothetical protein
MHFATLFMLVLITGAVVAMVIVHRSGQPYGVGAGCHGGHAHQSVGEYSRSGQEPTTHEHGATDEPIAPPRDATPIGASQR